MRKFRLNKKIERVLAVFICICMIIPMFAGVVFFDIFKNASVAKAEATGESDEYKNETLLYRWEHDSAYLTAPRPLYASVGNTFGGVVRRTIFHVFAFEGDTICIGSSVADSRIDMDYNVSGTAGKDKGSVDVVMTDLNGVKHAIDIRYEADKASGETEEGFVKTGFIENPGVEHAALLMEKIDGKFIGKYHDDDTNKDYEYVPYTYTVTETGVYTFEFYSYDKTGATGVAIPRNDMDMPSSENGHMYGKNSIKGWIAALDITVFDESGEKQHGRTYADYLALEMGPTGYGVKDSYYILTTDSYIYKMQFNGATPYTYNFFSNNKGLYDPATGEIIYTSVKDINNSNNYGRMGAAYKYPGTKDTDMLKSFYIFLEYPDDQLEGELYEKAVQPDPATNLRFVSTIDIEGKEIPGAYTGEGGYFAFDVEEATTATLRLEFKNKLEKFVPVEISGAVTPHSTNYFYWNGKDGAGTVIPEGSYDLEDLAFTVTTKAGEIHFPIIDMEYAKGGITFTRLSHIYDKNGEQLDTVGSIYDLTKNVIYYDDTAIYYGETAASTGFSEREMTLALDLKNDPYISHQGMNNAVKDFFKGGGTYWTYNNMRSDGGEYAARQSDYINTHTEIRIGDHSHTTNVIEYFDKSGNLITSPTDEQQKMIDYLSSDNYPVGKSAGTGVYYKNYQKSPTTSYTRPETANENATTGYHWQNVVSAQTTTDYAIANFWTFIPAKPAVSESGEQMIEIADPPANHFILSGRVFFDADNNRTFDDMTEAGDYALSGVTLNLYKKTADTAYNADKTYVKYDSTNDKVTEVTGADFSSSGDIYELIDTGKTTGDGLYRFTGLEYDPTDGTDYLYQVVKPANNYGLTTGSRKAIPLGDNSMYYGYYANKSYNNDYSGTEVQHIVVGGTGVDPKIITCNKQENATQTVCAVDVGYNYAIMKQSLMLKKEWNVSAADTHPDAVAYEVHCHLADDNNDHFYTYRVMSAITSWQYEDEYLPQQFDGKHVDNFYVAAEYYIDGDYIYKQTYDFNFSTGKYSDFIGKAYRAPLSALETIAEVEIKNFSNIPDLSVLKSEDITWNSLGNDSVYKAVLDRNVSSDSTTVTITNSKQQGTIEIFKYYNESKEENALQGATFRCYELQGDVTYDKIKELVEKSSKGDSDATAELKKYQVGSATTRSNGRVAFPGLDPKKSYVIREVYPPAGYRILNEFYVVYPEDNPAEENEENGIYKFDENNNAMLNVGNAPADSNFYVIKRIEGRAWQSDDAFSFTISNEFDSEQAKENVSDANGIKIDTTEYGILGYGDATAIEAAKEFAAHFQEDSGKLGNKQTVGVKNSDEFYSYNAKDINDRDYEFTYADRKRSEALLVDGSTSGTVASFYGIAFPMAGVYTFTIKENDFTTASDTVNTLAKSPLEYTVTITVNRVRNEGTDESADINKENSHLVAEVSSITYRDTSKEGSVSQIFAGSSPVFTNTYAPAPAVQTTSYEIQKNFTGRESGWLGSDEFTVKIDGHGAVTQEAIKTDKLRIYGFEEASVSTPNAPKNTEETGWVYTFTYDNHGTGLPFTAFIFDNITFDVKYVNATTGEEWDPSEHDGAESPSESDITKGVWTAQTIPVEYWLDIYEDIPDEAKKSSVLSYNGITYDGSHYFLHITLRNAESKVSSTEEEDGIIDEIDMQLFKAESFGEIDMSKPVATCKTVQEVLDETEWKDRSKKPSSGAYSWWYVDNTGGIRRDESGGSVIPAGHKQLIRKTEVHADGSDHTMTITNTYDAIYTWTPKLTKILTGRNWAANDEFVFEIECTEWPGSDSEAAADACVDMPSDKEVVIKSGTAGHTESFEDIKFKKTGTYVFTVTEKNHTGGTSIAPDKDIYSYSVTVVIEDDNKGHLTATFNGYDLTAGIVFTNVYSDTAKSFEIGVQKTLVGRNWKAGDEFSFKIAPDGDTVKAIEEGFLKMSAEFGDPSSDGSYTVMVGYEPSTSVESVLEKIFGEVTVVKLPADKDSMQYNFTVSEVTDGLKAKNMKLRGEKEIVLTVNAARKVDAENVPTGELDVSAAFAYMSGGASGSGGFGSDSSDPKAVIPFVNVCLGQLTVEKEVVSSIDDTTEFNFIAEFEFNNDIPNDERKITVSKKGEADKVLEPSSTDGSKSTFSFTLKHGEKVVFTDVAPYTSYTVTETDSKTENYVLLRATNADGENLTLGGAEKNQVAGDINGDSADTVRFVNGKIHRLPAAGGTGLGRLILLGIMLVAASGICLVLRGMARRKAVVSPKKANSRYK